MYVKKREWRQQHPPKGSHMKKSQSKAKPVGKEKNALAIQIGKRIRAFRKERGYTQEVLAERAECHTTYIGQIERGEKNATLESIARVAAALGVPLTRLLEMTEGVPSEDNYPLLCYRLVAEKPKEEQKLLHEILRAVEDYRRL